MTRAQLELALPAGDRLVLDTTTLAAYFDATEATHPVARHVIDELVTSGRNPAIVSMITVMEILVRPLRASPPGHHTVLAFLRHLPNLEAVPLSVEMAQEAAALRAVYRLSPPDALVIGSGIACQVAWLVTNDADWPRKLAGHANRIGVCMLRDYLPFA
jgi:predicted nucleic acid-binding protein